MLGEHQRFICNRLQKACKHEDRAWEDGHLVMMLSPKADSHLRRSFQLELKLSSMYCCTAKMRVPAAAAGACMTIAMRR